MPLRTTFVVALVLLATAGIAAADWREGIDALAADAEAQVINWRRDIHQHPELSNREYRTAKVVAGQLERMGIEVTTGIAHTGVVGILRGGKPGPVVALRADMDALPVTEQVNLPFASKAIGEYRGEEVGVMHACGHDTHVAMILGVAEVFSALREEIPGTVMFIFQPAEEGAPEGEEGGAALMLKEGLFEILRPEAIFGIHTGSLWNTGVIAYRPGPAMASSDSYSIRVIGKQTHGSRPWAGVDPIVTSAQIINGLQTIVSRHTDITMLPAVVSIGSIDGGIRFNIIPDEVYMTGTIRTFDEDVKADIHRRIIETAEGIAKTQGATAEVEIDVRAPVTVNDPELMARMLPTVERVVGADRMAEAELITGAEDFSYFALEVPGMYVFIGATPWDQNAKEAPSNHSPLFFADEDALLVGVKVMSHLAADFLSQQPTSPSPR